MTSSSANTPAKTAQFRIRPRTEADLDACVRVLSTIHEQNAYPLNWPTDPSSWLTPGSLLAVWVAEEEDTREIIGHVVLSRSDVGNAAAALWSDGPTAVVNRLYVDPAARGRGVGAALMTRAVAEAKSRALHPVLDVASTAPAAAALYERLGWTLLAADVEQEWLPGQWVKLRCYAAPTT
ncbi:GNAT family N-acetyltransferase [Streptomyces sp. ME02-8801-2C]|uniref:GNAT family N-acetyltransferase n=1 Tax=Streptomyces sp. ME02-8801-2C TaxID=3028680 RepID=UPI0029B3B405|nr:GNAT family N-acetyltransferase [Streptomyces sp. ME02-8801-2C]MDX3457555.1 GNAT family N-acetyltransferase [Streptomyces sp. ME02-8801-2C]